MRICLPQNNSSSSDDSDSEYPISPLRPVRPRHGFPAASNQKEVPPNKETKSIPNSDGESVREAPALSVSAREQYQSAIRGLGSAKSRFQALSQPQFSSTPAVSSGSKSALVPEEEYLADDWLEDDLEDIQPKKKRFRVEQNGIRGDDIVMSSATRSQNKHLNSDTTSRSNNFIIFIHFMSLHISLFYLYCALLSP